MSVGERLRIYVRFTRPFTLMPPLIGMVSGSVTAIGALAHRNDVSFLEELSRQGGSLQLLWVGLGALLAVSLNAASNILNQWTDLVNDRVNKPHRPLPAGEVTVRETLVLIVLFYAISFGLAAAIRF